MPDQEDRAIAPPRVAIIVFPGTNSEEETVDACRDAGMDARLFWWSEDPEKLRGFDAYVFSGGFAHEDLHLMTRVNGVVKQDASTKQMYFKVPRIIAELSMGLTLVPGDIIATGTPPGVGYARKPPIFLKPGDVMETEIVGIGTMRNTIAAAS